MVCRATCAAGAVLAAEAVESAVLADAISTVQEKGTLASSASG